MLRKWGYLIAALLASAVLAILASTPPSPNGLDTPADQFSSARAMEDVRIISERPHPTGSEENAKVRNYLDGRMNVMGMEVSLGASKLNERSLARLNRWSGEEKTEQTIFNVIGVLPGRDRTLPAILLMAHHDTVWGSPGAADDTAGVAAILEIIRALKVDGLQQRDIIVLFTDGEEVGLQGAVNFFNVNPLHETIGAVINFEARGGGGVASLFQTSAENGDAARLFARAVKQPSASSLSTFVYSVLPNDTDLTPALAKDYTAYNIANIGRAEYYHSPEIDADALSEATLQHMGSQGLDLTRALLSANELPARKPDATFFDVFGLFTLIYPAFFGWIFLTLGGVFYAISVRRKTDLKSIGEGFLRMTGFLLIGAALLYGLNMISGSGSGSNYYDRLAAITELEVTAAFLCLAMFFALFGRKGFGANARLGAALPIFGLGIAGQAVAPTAAYFITLPVLLCALVSMMLSLWPDKKRSLAGAAILTTLVTGYMLALGHLLMLGVGPDMLSVAILPAAIAALSVLPLYAGLPKPKVKILALMGLLASTVIALWIRFDPIASTVPLY